MQVLNHVYGISSYTKKGLKDSCETIACKKPEQFYNYDLINYKSAVDSDDALCNEVISEWLIDNYQFLGAVEQITRKNSYVVKNHHKNKKKTTGWTELPNNRIEEHIAKDRLFGNNYDIIGNVVDYQVPLKDYTQENKCIEVGKIDLIAVVNDPAPTISLIELKRPKSEETMLRCVLEGLTYYKRLDVGKLILNMKDENLLKYDPDKYTVRVVPLVFEDSQPYFEMQELKAGCRENLRVLIEKLSNAVVRIEPCYLVENSGEYTCHLF